MCDISTRHSGYAQTPADKANLTFQVLHTAGTRRWSACKLSLPFLSPQRSLQYPSCVSSTTIILLCLRLAGFWRQNFNVDTDSSEGEVRRRVDSTGLPTSHRMRRSTAVHLFSAVRRREARAVSHRWRARRSLHRRHLSVFHLFSGCIQVHLNKLKCRGKVHLFQ